MALTEGEMVDRIPASLRPVYTFDECLIGLETLPEELVEDFQLVRRGLYEAHFQNVPDTLLLSKLLSRVSYTILKQDRRLFHQMAGTRPYITLDMAMGSFVDRDLWYNARVKHRDDPCPVCLETKAISERHSPIDGVYGTRCSHYLCKTCWEELMRQERVFCPVCRDDVSVWARCYLGANWRTL